MDMVGDRPFILLIGFQRFDQSVPVRIYGFILIIIGEMFFRLVQRFLLIGFTMIGIIHRWWRDRGGRAGMEFQGVAITCLLNMAHFPEWFHMQRTW